jgi:hypothetical protein
MKAPKYRFGDPNVLSDDDSNVLSAKDQKLVARLIRKYGREAVLAAVKAIPESRRGRPSRGNLPIYEAVHLAQWFEEEVEEHRERGSKHPIRDAEIALYEMETGQTPDLTSKGFEAWRHNKKKRRSRGSRHLKDIKQAAEARSRALRGRK